MRQTHPNYYARRRKEALEMLDLWFKLLYYCFQIGVIFFSLRFTTLKVIELVNALK